MSAPRATPARRYKDLSGTNVDRLNAISDGIFGVAMTLLVLGLAVPQLSAAQTGEAGLWHALQGLAPSILVYTLSFMTLGIFWNGQATQLSQLERSNRYFTWLHLAFLFGVTLVPFSTALLAHYYWLRVALVVYWLNIVFEGAALLVAFEYGLRAGLFGSRAGQTAHLIRGRVLVAQLLYAVGTALCVVFPTWVSIAAIVLFQLNFVLTPRIPILDRF